MVVTVTNVSWTCREVFVVNFIPGIVQAAGGNFKKMTFVPFPPDYLKLLPRCRFSVSIKK